MGVAEFGLWIGQPDASRGWVQARPFADGRDLLVEACKGGLRSRPPYLGVEPRYVLGDDLPLLAADGREIRLAQAGCDEESCCGALYVTVRREGGHVVWTGWRDPANPAELPEPRFDARRYEAEVRRATADRSWETPVGAVARLLDARLRRRTDWLERFDIEVQDVWERDPDQVDLILMHPRVRLTTRSPFVQFLLPIALTGEEPEAQAEELEARLTAGDPREVAEVCGGSPDCAEALGYVRPDLA